MDATNDGFPAARPLNPLGDTSVAKGFARREHAGTVEALSFVTDLMARTTKPAYARFAKRRRLEPSGIAACVADFERVMGELADTVGRYDHDTPATRARPRGGYHEKSRLCVSRDQRDFRLVSVTMGIGSKRFFFQATPTVLGWTRHAAERCYERMGGTERSNVVIGKALARQLPLASLAIEAVHARREHCDLAIPAGDGLLLGQVYEVPDSDWQGSFAHLDGNGGSARQAPPISTLPEAVPKTVLGTPYVACWRAMTYIGPDEMRPDQRRYADEWNRVGAITTLVDDGTQGAGMTAMRQFGPAALAAHRADCGKVVEWLAGLMADPDYAGILCRTPYPPALETTPNPHARESLLPAIVGEAYRPGMAPRASTIAGRAGGLTSDGTGPAAPPSVRVP